MKTGYYKADVLNGVYFASEVLEDTEQDVLTPRRFQEALNTCGENETLCSFFDETSFDVLNEIIAEYGVRE